MNTANSKNIPFSRNVGMNAVYLMACALHASIPTEASVRDLDELLRFCKRHSIVSMVAMALEGFWQTVPSTEPAVTKPWLEARDKAIRKNILLNAERERILQYLESIGCWYMPLKGSFLQHDYPKFGMRQMSDNDILFDPQFSQQVCDFMCGNGYTAEEFGESIHDTYVRPPVYNFEMHRKAFSPFAPDAMVAYYDDIRPLLRKDEGNNYGYHMSDEDFYIYMVAHAYHHFTQGGTGIRSLADFYVFLDKHGPLLNREYIDAELCKLELTGFEARCRMLSQKLFSAPQPEIPLNLQEQEFLDIFLDSGTYGSRQQGVEIALYTMNQESPSGGFVTKLCYFWRRMFPPMKFMVLVEPVLLRHKWLLPLAYGKRLLTGLIQKPKLIFNELRYLAKSNRAAKHK